MGTSAVMYLVQKIAWQTLADLAHEFDISPDEFEAGKDIFSRADYPGEGEPVKAFRDAGLAETFCRELELKARAGRNPFRHGKTLADLTSMPDGVFRDWLLDAGLTPPPRPGKKTDKWAAWWDRTADRMSDAQAAKVWEALDKVRFYEVVELEPAD